MKYFGKISSKIKRRIKEKKEKRVRRELKVW
jgi:hypothetical protein